jgi:AraC-like DNA-binding protein
VSGRRIEAGTYAPPAGLEDVVASFWWGRWHLPDDAPHTSELLSDPCVHFVIEENDREPPSGRVVGVWTRLWRRTLGGKGRVFGVKLKSGAVRAFASVPAVAFTNRIEPLDRVFGDAAAALTSTVLAHAMETSAFEAFAAALSAHKREDDGGQRSFAVALVERIVRDRDITSVERLAAVAGAGPRALQRLFREHVGATPKAVIARSRLQEAALRLERAEGEERRVSLAKLAADLGYTDQAHFARDFKNAVGKSPRAFLKAVWR